MNPLIQVQNVSRRFRLGRNEVTAVNVAAMEVCAGEFLAIAGPSGSGKSTLLNLLGCIDRPSTGSIQLAGVNTTLLGPSALGSLRRQEIGFVFQSFNLIPVFTALENVEFPLLLMRIPKAERRRLATLALEQVGLEGRSGQRPDLLSGGERQRVAVARAIVHTPALVLADEPTANLDSATALRLIALMRDLNQRLGITFIFTTHDARLLERAERVITLRDGRIVRDSHAAFAITNTAAADAATRS